MRVLHLVGSPTSEFFAELSRLYARDCLGAVPGSPGWEHVIAHIDPGGAWRFPASLEPHALAGAAPLSLEQAVARLQQLRPDVAVPQMFCLSGMTNYRALLDLLDIPFVGNTADVMALGAHKPRAKAVVAAVGVAVPAAVVLRRSSPPPGDEELCAPPWVVKPADADNSAGVSLVLDRGELDDAVAAALAHSDEVLVERYIELGREVRCAVLDVRGRLEVLPIEEYSVDAMAKPIRDAADKLARAADGNLSLVAKDATHARIVSSEDPMTAAVAQAARLSYSALGCRHYGLFDFRVDPAGTAWFLEAGLYCSFARSSVVAVMASAAGIPVQELFESAVHAALAQPRNMVAIGG